MTARIADYALLSDCRGAALVGRSGSIDWMCVPRFDSAAVFARLLGGDACHWSLTPTAAHEATRAYLDDTMVLCTEFRTTTGVVALTDAMALDPDERGHRIGQRSPHIVVRVVEGIEGAVELDLDVSPRGEYGLTVPMVLSCPGGAYTRGGPDRYVFSSPVPLRLARGQAKATFTVEAGERCCFALAHDGAWDAARPTLTGAEILALLEGTVAGWRSWSTLHQSYDGPYRDLVRLSGRVLQALTYAPSGAIVAAPTTSLPETVGGERNWDYRFCWVRDASLTMEALWVAACPDEALDFFEFFATAAGGELDAGNPLQILYRVEGERLATETVLDHLPGYRGSRPVRIGNDAWHQVQLDVYGELLNAASLLAEQLGTLPDADARFLVSVADAAARRWREPDQGIWEVRGRPRHFLHSKLMCWVALDRAVRLAEVLRAGDRVAAWCAERDAIRTAILEQAWSDQAGAYTQSFGSDDLDASALMLAIVGFLPANDPRMRATIDAIARELLDERGFVLRYRSADGLHGAEGSFAICTFWLVQCYALAGDTSRARDLFERVVSHANDVGLLSEEIDTTNGELLGNFPQAFTHVGLINAAWAIATAEAEAEAGKR